MKLIIKILSVAAMAMLLVSGPAQSQEVRIGVVNIQRVMAESPQLKEAQEKLKDEFSPRERELAAKAKAFEDRVAQLQKDAEVMGPEERAAAERELNAEQREIQRDQKVLQEDAEIRQRELIGPAEQSIVQDVQEYAQKAGYDVVLAQGVVFASDKANITDEILEAMKAGE